MLSPGENRGEEEVCHPRLAADDPATLAARLVDATEKAVGLATAEAMKAAHDHVEDVERSSAKLLGQSRELIDEICAARAFLCDGAEAAREEVEEAGHLFGLLRRQSAALADEVCSARAAERTCAEAAHREAASASELAMELRTQCRALVEEVCHTRAYVRGAKAEAASWRQRSASRAASLGSILSGSAHNSPRPARHACPSTGGGVKPLLFLAPPSPLGDCGPVGAAPLSLHPPGAAKGLGPSLGLGRGPRKGPRWGRLSSLSPLGPHKANAAFLTFGWDCGADGTVLRSWVSDGTGATAASKEGASQAAGRGAAAEWHLIGRGAVGPQKLLQRNELKAQIADVELRSFDLLLEGQCARLESFRPTF